jgi:hypothetical protein
MPDTCSCEPCRALDLALDRDLEARRSGVGIAEAARAVAEAGAEVDRAHDLDLDFLNAPLWPKPWHFLADIPAEERKRRRMATPTKTSEPTTLIPVGGVQVNGVMVVKPTTIKFRGVLDGPNVGGLIADALRANATAFWDAGVKATIPLAAEAAYRQGRDAGLQLAVQLAGPMAQVTAELDKLAAEMRRPRVRTVQRDGDGNLLSVIESPA